MGLRHSASSSVNPIAVGVIKGKILNLSRALNNACTDTLTRPAFAASQFHGSYGAGLRVQPDRIEASQITTHVSTTIT
jgi:hypothetical protein